MEIAVDCQHIPKEHICMELFQKVREQRSIKIGLIILSCMKIDIKGTIYFSEIIIFHIQLPLPYMYSNGCIRHL